LKLTANDDLFKPGLEGTRDAYWEGKSFGKIAAIVRIADQTGDSGMRDDLIHALEAELEDWFDGRAPRFFYYDRTWKTLIGEPAMYHSGTQLNDHHFHYGYYVYAAGTIAQYDRAWAERWAPCVELLIRDAGDWRRDDPMFPFLRYFDPYAGHSWATGTTFSENGNNEESSAEDLNFAAAVALWGSVMNRPEIRDAGLYVYSTLVDAVEQYWYDVDGAVYPKGFSHPAVGIVWGAGAVYDTWFSYLPPFIHGIQLTPMLAGSLWLGRRPDNIDRVWAHAQAQYHGPIRLWRDMFWMMLSLSHPEQTSAWFEDDHAFLPEFGNSMAYLDQFITDFSVLGKLQPKVTGDTPLHAVFERDGVRNYTAYNVESTPRTVRFSDGATLSVEPRTLGVARATQRGPTISELVTP
jgi:endoglucanase Acf2